VVLGQFSPYDEELTDREDMKALGSMVIYAALYPQQSFSSLLNQAENCLKDLQWTAEFKAILLNLLQGNETFASISAALKELETLRVIPLYSSQSEESSVMTEIGHRDQSRLSEEDYPRAEDPRLQAISPQVESSVSSKHESAAKKETKGIRTPFSQYQFAPSPIISHHLRDEEEDFDYSDPRNSGLVEARRRQLGLLKSKEEGPYAPFQPGQLPDDTIHQVYFSHRYCQNCGQVSDWQFGASEILCTCGQVIDGSGLIASMACLKCTQRFSRFPPLTCRHPYCLKCRPAAQNCLQRGCTGVPAQGYISTETR
jgi:hypothetical protein